MDSIKYRVIEEFYLYNPDRITIKINEVIQIIKHDILAHTYLVKFENKKLIESINESDMFVIRQWITPINF